MLGKGDLGGKVWALDCLNRDKALRFDIITGFAHQQRVHLALAQRLGADDGAAVLAL